MSSTSVIQGVADAVSEKTSSVHGGWNDLRRTLAVRVPTRVAQAKKLNNATLRNIKRAAR